MKTLKFGLRKSLPLHGRIDFQGLKVSVENRAGSVRSGTNAAGVQWRTKMFHPYGYIRGTLGVDGDHLDCYVGPNRESRTVFIVHQQKPGTGAYDEDKVLLGFDNEIAARDAFLAHYDDHRFLGPITTMSIEEFKRKALATRNHPCMVKAHSVVMEPRGTDGRWVELGLPGLEEEESPAARVWNTVQTLARSNSSSLERIVKQSGLSPREAMTHLDRMIREGKIIRDGRIYRLGADVKHTAGALTMATDAQQGFDFGKSTTRLRFLKAMKSTKVGPDSYDLTMGEKTLRGHWRSIHGHKVFICENGDLYEFAGYKSVKKVETPHPFIAQEIKKPPRGHVTRHPEDTEKHPFQARYVVDGLDKKEFEASGAINGGFKSSGAHRLSTEGVFRAGDLNNTGWSRSSGIARDLPHVSWSKEAAHAGGIIDTWNKGDQVAAATAASRHKKTLEAIGATPAKIAAAVKRQQAEAAKRKVESAKKTAAAVTDAKKKVDKLPPISDLLQQIHAAKAAGESPHGNVVKLLAGLFHSGMIRLSTRGGTRGQIIVDTTVARRVMQDPAASKDAHLAAVTAMTASVGFDERSGKEAPRLSYTEYPEKNWADAHTRNLADEAAHIHYYNRRNPHRPQVLTAEQQQAAVGSRAAINQIRESAWQVATALQQHADGKHPELQALLTGRGDAAKVAAGSKTATAAISRETQRAEVKAALAAQENDKWTPPPGWTMAGFGRGATLDPYNIKGVNWAMTVKRGINGFGTGLGKTLCALAVGAKLNADGKTDQSIICVPVPKVHDFVEEAKKAMPRVKIVAVTGSPEERKAALRRAATADFVVFGHSAFLMRNELAYMVAHKKASLQVDEVHRLKNAGKGALTMGMQKALDGREYAIGYTATPVPNYVEDFFNLVDMYRPGALGVKEQVGNGRALIDELLRGENAPAKRLDALHHDAKAWVFRKDRNDPDVAPYVHVPPHQEIEETYPHPGPAHAEWDDWVANHAAERCNSLIAMLGMTLTLQRMNAISPALNVPKRFPKKTIKDYTGPEPKMDEAVEKIKSHLMNPDNKGKTFVVACEFTQGLDRLRHRLQLPESEGGAGIATKDIVDFRGGMNDTEREAAKQRTNDGEAAVMLLSTKAGGEGLNLQGNSKKGTGPNAILALNEPWTDKTVRQLYDRISRRGTQWPTTSYMGRIEGTVENQVRNLVGGKGAQTAIIRHGELGAAANLEGLVGKLPLRDQVTLLNMSSATRAKFMRMVDEHESGTAEKKAIEAEARAISTPRRRKAAAV